MSTIQKHIGLNHKISIHENPNGSWELALIDAHSDTNGFVPPQFWAYSEDGKKLLYLNSQVDETSDIIFCVRIDQLPNLWKAARRYAFAMQMARIPLEGEYNGEGSV